MTAVRPPQLEQQLAAVTDRLLRDHAALPAEVVHDALRVVRERFASATVLTYLPVLVERGVREHLRPLLPDGTARGARP